MLRGFFEKSAKKNRQRFKHRQRQCPLRIRRIYCQRTKAQSQHSCRFQWFKSVGNYQFKQRKQTERTWHSFEQRKE